MEYLRILNPDKYNVEQGQFTRFAFKNTGGGLSVVAWDCIQATGVTVCAHLRKHFKRYRNVMGDPPVFWRFDIATTFSAAPHTVESDETNGDCHHLVKGIDDETLWKVFEVQPFNNFSVCNNGTVHPATVEEIIALKTD